MSVSKIVNNEESGLEFKSALENLMPAEELNFEPTPSFGRWAKFLPKEAVTHPAKANLNLIDFLIKHYTKEGDVVLDPLAGTYSTCVLAALSNRIGVGVEIEDKFYKWGLEAKKLVEEYPTLLPKGKMVVLKGDARKLSELLKHVDVVITSPPYANAVKDGGGPNYYEFLAKAKGLPHEDWVKKEREWQRSWKGYSDSEENIGNLPLGNIDVVITSPPYSNVISRQGGDLKVKNVGISTLTAREYSENPSNIGNLPMGSVDVVITSPPYTNTAAENPNVLELQKRGWIHKGDLAKFLPQNLSADNIGNLPLGLIDCIITSPPYASVDNVKKNSEEFWRKAKESGRRWGSKPPSGTEDKTQTSEGNIAKLPLDSNKKRETYLEAMLKVYSEMWKVLKPNGLAIIIVKPFIRRRKVVDLPYITYLLMAKVGFTIEKLYKLRLKQKSFWRILYYKKNPNAPRIAHEYVIVARKASAFGK
jgi:DNA modification methylase